jgi:hypothetical protein
MKQKGKREKGGIAKAFSRHPMTRNRIVVVERTIWKTCSGQSIMKAVPKVFVVLVMLTVLLPAGTPGQSHSQAKRKAEKQSGTTKLRIEVTAGEKSQPVENASIYVRYVEESLLKNKNREMNLKTNRDGVVKVPEVPRGKVLIQVIAEGWKTFGRWYDLESDEQTIKIHLEKPPRWY